MSFPLIVLGKAGMASCKNGFYFVWICFFTNCSVMRWKCNFCSSLYYMLLLYCVVYMYARLSNKFLLYNLTGYCYFDITFALFRPQHRPQHLVRLGLSQAFPPFQNCLKMNLHPTQNHQKTQNPQKMCHLKTLPTNHLQTEHQRR